MAPSSPFPCIVGVLALFLGGALLAPPLAADDTLPARPAGAPGPVDASSPLGAEADDDEPGDDDDGEAAEDGDAEDDAEDDAEAEEEEDTGPFEKWEEVTEDAERLEGVIPVYRKREDVYLELSPSHFESDYLIAISIARGIGSRFVLGGLPWGTSVVNFRRAGDHIQLVEQNTRFVSSDDALANAVDLSFGESILKVFPIKSENDSTQAIIIDVGGFLTSDHPDLGFFLGLALDGSASLDGERSAVTGIEIFPENVEIDVQLTFNPGNRKDLDLTSVTDTRYIPISVHYSISRLPETSYVPRYADARVGYFLTAHKDFSRGDESGYFRRFVKRWHLEKKNPKKDLSEPVEPIVFYIDDTVPEEYRKYVREGIEAWQPAFEEAGFEKAIVARDVPKDDPEFNPLDVRYNTVRWITSSEPSFGAIGPSRMDPRTGQILDSDVLIEDIFLLAIKTGYQRLVDTRELAAAESFPAGYLDPIVRRIWESPAIRDEVRQNVCTMADGFARSASLIGYSLLEAGRLEPGEPVPMAYVGEALRWVVLHEVGHTLGLRHNFKSSIDTPFDKLHDEDWVEEHGLMGSVMDYAASNIALDPDAQGYYYGPGVGTYDRWAIRYGYTPFGAKTPDDESEELDAIASESALPGHTYATDEDTYPSGACDPYSNIFDLSSDPIAYGEQLYALTDRLLERDDLHAVMLHPGDEYAKLRRAVNSLLGTRFSAVTRAFRYVGGSTVSRDQYGTPDARPPLVPIPAAEQRRALAFILEHAYADEVFDMSPGILDRLGPDRWSHWGSNASESRVDFPLYEWVDTYHRAPLNVLFSGPQLMRMQEAEQKSADGVTTAELFETISRGIWSELEAPAAPISALRRHAQRVHLEKLIDLALATNGSIPADARALARLHLQRLDGRIAGRLEGGAADDYTAAHLEEARSRIAQALEVRIVTER